MVVGTAIDPAMGDEIKVTVVATGLGELRRETAPVTLVRGAVSASAPNYKDLESPAIRRNPARREIPVPPRAPQQMAVGAERLYDEAMIDIPAFLRRQAD